MKAQTRRGAAIETGVNLVVGFALTWCANTWILPWWGFHPPVDALLTIGAVMTLVSIARQFTLRRLFEWLRIRKVPPAFLYIAEELAAERLRQINSEGYSLDHDDGHASGEIARGAAAYAYAASLSPSYRAHLDRWYEMIQGEVVGQVRKLWPWGIHTFKATSPRRDLVKAGAMIIAEIGRLDRAALQRGAV